MMKSNFSSSTYSNRYNELNDTANYNASTILKIIPIYNTSTEYITSSGYITSSDYILSSEQIISSGHITSSVFSLVSILLLLIGNN